MHTADLHLGRQFHGISLEQDHAMILEQLMQALIAHKPDVFVISGDIFDRATPPATAVRQFNEFIKQVAHKTKAVVVLIAGNHDSGDRIESMSVMTDQRRALIRGPLSGDERTLLLHDESGPVAISALPFGYEFAARECFGDETIATPEHVIRAQIASTRRHVPNGARWIVVAHAFVLGANSSESERPLARVGGIETVPHDVFTGAHYVALGHLHRPQHVGATHIRYAGSPLAFSFDEVDTAKSMTLINLAADGTTEIQTLPFAHLRGVRVLRGKLADLLVTQASNDFVKVVLTDQVSLIDPMKRIREVFPNASMLTYQRDELPSGIGSTEIAHTSLTDPSQVISNFLEHVRGSSPTEGETELIVTAIAAIREQELRT